MADGEIAEIKYRARHKNGSWRWMLSRDTIFARDESGKPVQTLGVANDITELEQAQKALSQSQAQLRLALEASSTGFWDWQIGDRVYFSPEWKTMLGYKVEEIENKFESWANLVHPEDLPVAMSAIHNHLADRTPIYQAEFRMRHKSGKWQWILSRGRGVERNQAGKIVRMLGIHRDITERKELEQAALDALQLVACSG